MAALVRMINCVPAGTVPGSEVTIVPDGTCGDEGGPACTVRMPPHRARSASALMPRIRGFIAFSLNFDFHCLCHLFSTRRHPSAKQMTCQKAKAHWKSDSSMQMVVAL